MGGHPLNLRNKITLVIVGRSGCGKGMQAGFIIERLGRKGTSHLETGRFLRALTRKETATAAIGRALMKKGELLPSWLAAFTWLKETVDRGAITKHLVFDGAPRRVWEAALIDEVVGWHGRFLPLCVHLDVTRAEAMRRLLSRGRADDTREVIRNRLNFFEKDVAKAVQYYRSRGRLIRINGNPPPDAVWRELDRSLSRRLGTRWPKR